jgi:hypothetical protein
MPRRARIVIAGIPWHIIQDNRGQTTVSDSILTVHQVRQALKIRDRFIFRPTPDIL